MKKMNKFLLLFGLCCSMAATIAIGTTTMTVAQAEESTAVIGGVFKEEYGIDETIILPDFNLATEYIVNVQAYENDTCKILQTYENPKSAKYTFEEAGTYVISYTYCTDDESLQSYSYTMDVIEKAIFDISAFPQTAYINSRIDFGSVKLIYKGKSKTADIAVFDPDGNSLDVSSGIFAPTKVGKYQFTVSTTLNGQYYSDKFSVEVLADASKLFESETATFIPNYNLPSWSDQGNGVLITTKTPQTKVRYTNVIDISKLTSDIPVIEFQVLYGKDETTGYTFADMGRGTVLNDLVHVKLTDVHNEDNYIYYMWRSGEWYLYNNMYEQAISYVGTAPRTKNLPKWYSYFPTGAAIYNTFRGADGKAVEPNTGHLFNFSMDYETNSTYMFTQPVGTKSVDKYFITSYADRDAFGNNAFDKFTTGEVYLELVFSLDFDYSDQAGIVVTSIAGNSLSGSVVNGSTNTGTFEDNVKPEINLAIDKDYIDNMPTGYVGVSYPVPSAYALDNISGECKVYCGVTEQSSKTAYTIKNGKFMPDQAGVYKITYTATDAYGNIDTKVLTVNVKDEDVPKINFAFAEGTVAKYKSEFAIPKLQVSGGSGKIDYSYKLFYNDVEIDATKAVTLSELGTLKFVFTAQDYLGAEIGNVNNALILEIIETDDMFVTFNSFVPKYVKQNTTLVFPDISIISASTNEIVQAIKVNGTELGADRTYNVTEAVGSVLTVEYVANNGKEWSQTFAVEVLKNSDDVCESMVSNINGATLGNDLDGGLIYQVNGDKYIVTPNPVPSDGFVLNANLHFAKLDSYVVCFYDCYDANKTVELAFSMLSDGRLLLKVNGGTEYKITPDSMHADGRANLYLNFDSKTGRLSNYKDVLLAYVTDYVNGEVFEGFEDNLAYVSVAFVNAKNMTYTLLRMSNQNFGKFSNMLAVGPQIAIDGDMSNQYAQQNDTVVICKAMGVDLFDGIFDVYVSVIAPDGSLLISDEKADTEKSIVLSNSGVYTITYYSIDAHGGRGELLFEYTVPDYVGATISVNTTKIEVKVGEKFNIPTATVTDNLTPNELIDLYTFIIDENNHYTLVNGEYSLDNAGEYTLVYVAVDGSGNISRQTVLVVVK